MSEQLHHVPKQESLPTAENKEAAKAHLDRLREKAKTESESQADDAALEAIKKDIENSAVSKEDYNNTESAADTAAAPTYVSHELKEMGRRRTLSNVRRHMNAPSRVVSKVIHQPVVEKVSEVAAPTIARPSGIIGGGIAAVVGSAVLLYLTRHYGYRYNYLVFIVLFVGGFLTGMIIELIIRMLFIRKKA